MITPRMRDAINALLDQASERGRIAPTLTDLARRLGLKSQGHAHEVVRGLEARGLIDRSGPRTVFSHRCFKVFRVIRDQNGNAALERWG